MSSSQKTLRIQFEIPLSMAQEIEQLENAAHIASHREFFVNMLALWRWASRRCAEGKIIASVHPEKLTYNELTLPALDSLRSSAIFSNPTRSNGVNHVTEEHLTVQPV